MWLSLRIAGVVDPDTTQCYRWVMIPQFDGDGLLPLGTHCATWDEVTATFGNTPWRRRLLGELFPASFGATVEGMSFLEFFQTDRETGGSKGIVAVDLGGPDDQE